MNKNTKKKFKGFLSKYEDKGLQDIKSFDIKKYNINNLKEYKLIFLIYLENIEILIHELIKKDNKSPPLIKFKYQKKMPINLFIHNFFSEEKNKTLDDIFILFTGLIKLNKINFIDDTHKKSINLVINNELGKEIFRLNIPIKDNEDKINDTSLVYKLNPFFKNKDIITELCETYWSLNNNFVIFKSYHDDEIFLIYQNYDNNNIDIIKLINKQVIKSIKNIECKLSFIGHYFDNKNKYDYLLISDTKKDIKIYNISLNYQEILSFNNGESIGNISSCLLLFNEILLITSIFGRKKNDYTKVYSMNDIFKNDINKNDKLKNNITSGTNNLVICSLLFWEDSNYNKKYLIQLSNNKIQINNILDYTLYGYLETNEYNKSNIFYSGTIYNTCYLIAISNEGYIFLWNLRSKEIINKVNIINFTLHDCLLWSNTFLVITARNTTNKKSIIKIFDITQFKIINNIYVSDIEGISCIKKIIHHKKGNCLIASGDNNKIILFSL